MKILVVTNLYPPHHFGGYELGCRDVVEQLRARGHAVQVLTSTFRHDHAAPPEVEPEVWRRLQFNVSRTNPGHDKPAEGRHFAQAVKEFSPDVVYFWNQSGLCQWLPFMAHWLGCRMAFFLSDTNFVSWRIGAWLAGPARKNALARAVAGETFLARGWPVIQNRSCHFASEFLRQTALKAGIAFTPRPSLVAHWGITPEQFPFSSRPRWPVRRLLYVGQVIALKGVHTAIRAVARLAREKAFSGLTLTVAGGGQDAAYERELHALAAEPGLAGRVQFLGRVPRPELARIYAEHDALVFPSEWDEPFAITPLEAMACGLAVAGTLTGGSGELFRNRETAMTFRAGDEADCARALCELATDQELFETLRRNARREVLEKHTLAAMVDKLEQSLRALVED